MNPTIAKAIIPALVVFIRGDGHLWGIGLKTFPNRPGWEWVHQVSLGLEGRNLIYRAEETADYIVWYPVDGDESSPQSRRKVPSPSSPSAMTIARK